MEVWQDTSWASAEAAISSLTQLISYQCFSKTSRVHMYMHKNEASYPLFGARDRMLSSKTNCQLFVKSPLKNSTEVNGKTIICWASKTASCRTSSKQQIIVYTTYQHGDGDIMGLNIVGILRCNLQWHRNKSDITAARNFKIQAKRKGGGGELPQKRSFGSLVSGWVQLHMVASSSRTFGCHETQNLVRNEDMKF